MNESNPEFWELADRIRFQRRRLESRFQEQFDIATWQFRRTWGRLLKMLFQGSLLLILYLCVLPFSLYYRVRGIRLFSVLQRQECLS